jgi:hypothetical protein
MEFDLAGPGLLGAARSKLAPKARTEGTMKIVPIRQLVKIIILVRCARYLFLQLFSPLLAYNASFEYKVEIPI